MLLTPNGRFELNTKVSLKHLFCVISGFPSDPDSEIDLHQLHEL